jgi:hypothetical protein
MNPAPVELALRHVAETKHLVASLITSSESFDYARAKAILGELEVKVRTLGRVQAKLTRQIGLPPERVIRFPAPRERA